MAILSQLEPKPVFSIFEEICRIPHGSGNIDAISDYLVDFAKIRGLEYYQDALKNVIIIKEAAKGYEAAEPIIIQGHMDMVAVAEPGVEIDMTRDGLSLAVDGDFIRAGGTSLGGDDGIAVAYALALLDAEDVPHPRLEVVITVEEEVGMYGARGIDLSVCRAKRMLNIDSEEEGCLLTSCAGGAAFQAEVPLRRSVHEGNRYELSVSGLQGGHSGTEIYRERGNANLLLARILWECTEQTALHLVNLSGGEKDNAIPLSARAEFVMKEEREPALRERLNVLEAEIKNELKVKDPGFSLVLEKKEAVKAECIVAVDTKSVLELVLAMPAGVCGMSASVEGLVETSLNLGVFSMEGGAALLRYAVRSSVASQRDFLLHRMEILCRRFGGTADISGIYPGWEYRLESPLRDKMVEIYERLYGKKPVVQAIHAGVECGFFAEKIPDLDCVSFGPDILDIHTTKERLSISSAKRTWEYLLEILKQCR